MVATFYPYLEVKMLNRIIEEINAELERLYAARSVLEAYAEDRRHEPRTRKPLRKRKRPTVEAVTSPVAEVKVVKLPPRLEPKRRIRAVKAVLPEPRALASTIPDRPVFVAPVKAPQLSQPVEELRVRSDFGASIQAAERALAHQV